MSALQRCRGLGAVWLNKNLYLNLFTWSTYIVVFSFGKPCVEMEKLFRKKRLLLLYFLLYYGFYVDRSQLLILKYLQRHENLNLSMTITIWSSAYITSALTNKITVNEHWNLKLLNYLIGAERQTPCMDCRKNHVVSFYVWMRIKLRSKYFNQPKTANIETLPMIRMAKVFYCLCHKCETEAWRVCFALKVYFNQYN